MNRNDGGARLDRAVHQLMSARRSRKWLDALLADAMPQTIDEASIIQDGLMIRLGGRGGWKVGASSPTATPGCAPLATRLIYRESATLSVSAFTDHPYSTDEVLGAVASVHPGIEIADSRFIDFRSRSALEQAADCGNNGAYILGPASTTAHPHIDQTTVSAEVWVDGKSIAAKTGGNTAGNVQRLLTWLANHCAARGTPISAGDIVTSGSCTGLEIIQRGNVRAVLSGLGEVGVTLV
jgi:2-keto-4-pentenoate hydratase